MGVFVLAAGVAVFSIKIWTTLSRKKAGKALLLEGIIPGYTPLAPETLKALSDNNVKPLLPEEDKSSSETCFFFSERNQELAKAVHFSPEYRNLKLDGSQESLSSLDRWLQEYRQYSPSSRNTPARDGQTLSLYFDLAVYLEKCVTGDFPKQRYFPRLVPTMNALRHTEQPILLKLYDQYRKPPC